MAIITKPMLAPNEIPTPEQLAYPVLASPKLDGIRCLIIDGRVLSRTFKPIPNKHIQETFEYHMKHHGFPRDGLDGELIVDGKSFNEIQGDVMREEGKPNFTYYVFDYVTTTLGEPYSERMEKLKQLDLPEFCKKVLPKKIYTKEQLSEYEEECLDGGHEGLMIRSLNSPYKCGRSTLRQGWLLKLKRFVDSEAEVVGFVELMHNENEAEKDAFGRTKRSSAKEGLVPAGMLGKLLVKEVGETAWKGKEFGVGSGFDQAMRQEIWNNQSKYLGKIITYKFQPHGMKDLPRLPIWKGFRSKEDMSK